MRSIFVTPVVLVASALYLFLIVPTSEHGNQEEKSKIRNPKSKMEGGGIDRHEMGLTEWSLWFALPVFWTG